MIAVIADDFTGAAELGGLGLRYGMSVEIETEVTNDCKVDLLIIATDTRSLSKKQAGWEIFKIMKDLEKIELDWIYKKTDSVMRGHILEELLSILKASSSNQILLVPANPSFGRTISEGQYYIYNKPLHQTGFSEDPEFAPSSSNVLELLGNSDEIKTAILKREEKIPEGTISIGEAESNSDLSVWAKRIQNDIIPAGAAGFFAALLEQNGFAPKDNVINRPLILGSVRLYVCGSSFSLSREAIEEAKKSGKIVCEMPLGLFSGEGNMEKLLEAWTGEVIDSFEKSKSIIVAINQPIELKKGTAMRLRDLTALLVERVLDKVNVEELFIEGGATTSAIVRKAGFKKFMPIQEVAPGVIRMKVEEKPNMYITLKPGSYIWPKIIWQV
jgi:uncharacterized protein YgbK (DUF1537 family)